MAQKIYEFSFSASDFKLRKRLRLRRMAAKMDSGNSSESSKEGNDSEPKIDLRSLNMELDNRNLLPQIMVYLFTDFSKWFKSINIIWCKTKEWLLMRFKQNSSL